MLARIRTVRFYPAVIAGAAVMAVLTVMARVAGAVPNDGTVEPVTGDAPADVLPQVQDRVFEWAPTIIVLFAAIAIFGFSLLLLAVGVRKGLGKLTMLVRRA